MQYSIFLILEQKKTQFFLASYWSYCEVDLLVVVRIRNLCDTPDEIELMSLVILLYSFELETGLLLFFELCETHLGIMSILRILERIDHLECLFEERFIGGVHLLANHDDLDDIVIPIVEDMELSLWCQCMKNSHDIVTVFLGQWTSLEESQETRI